MAQEFIIIILTGVIFKENPGGRDFSKELKQLRRQAEKSQNIITQRQHNITN